MDRRRVIALTIALIAAIAVPLCASSGWARGLGVLALGGWTAAPAINYLSYNDFEEAGVPEGWTPTTGVYAGDYDYNGGGSLLLVEPQYAHMPPVTISGTTYSIRYRANFLSLNHGSNLLRVLNGESILGTIVYLNTGALRAQAEGGTHVSSAEGVMVTGESWIRVDYTQGTGLNATLEVFTSDNGISWTSRAKSDDGTSLAKADRTHLYGMAAGTVIDDVTQMEP